MLEGPFRSTWLRQRRLRRRRPGLEHRPDHTAWTSLCAGGCLSPESGDEPVHKELTSTSKSSSDDGRTTSGMTTLSGDGTAWAGAVRASSPSAATPVLDCIDMNGILDALFVLAALISARRRVRLGPAAPLRTLVFLRRPGSAAT